ncbi:mucin-5AC [Dugong dugon]
MAVGRRRLAQLWALGLALAWAQHTALTLQWRPRPSSGGPNPSSAAPTSSGSPDPPSTALTLPWLPQPYIRDSDPPVAAPTLHLRPQISIRVPDPPVVALANRVQSSQGSLLLMALPRQAGHAHYGSTDSSYEYYTDLPTVQPGPGGDPLGGVTIFPPLKTVPVVRALNPAHNGRVCSMWGNFHYKTFDGEIFRFPGLCNYVLASHCRAAYEDFNIQVRRSQEANATTPSKVVMKLDGMVLELTKASVLVNGHPVQLPFSQSGVLIEKSNMYLKVVARLGLVFMWNLDDSLLLELDDKYANQTCGLCGDFNGLSVFNEFLSNNVKLTPTEYGNLQKLDGPMEQCQDPAPTPMRNCTTGLEFCQGILLSQPFSGCRDLVDTSSYIEACQQDICLCADTDPTNCSCPTLAEYARQCVHAGGVPQDWRTSDLCPAQACPFNMEHHECGLPCPNTCSNLEHAQLCEDHCISGCFCPQGMVLDDITQNGCVAVDHCSCMYNGLSYAPGDVYSTDCANCTCSGGRWNCQDTPCPGTCSVLGGSHFSTFDEKQYTVHGDCSYVLAKPCDSSVFTVLAELRKCGLTDSETCLKSVTLSLGGGQTVIMVKASNEVFVNQIYTKLPISAANITLFKPSTFFIIAQTNLGLQLDIQLVPTMQVFLRLAPELRGLTCGLCGNFNSIQADDFQTISGVVEGTAAAFFNTWKTQASCPNVKNSFEDPCSLSVENEKYAQYWCSQLMDAKGPFALCHASVNPATYYSNCLFDTCNCEKSEDCLCAALSAYVHTCATKGVLLRSWRDGACTKPMTTCPESLTYRDYVSTCQPTCRSLSEEDVICHISFVPVDGCVCAEDTYLDDSGKCVPAASCPCYYGGSPVLSGESVHDGGAVCTCNQGKLTCIGGHTPTPVCAAPMVYFDCQNITSRAAGASCQKSCHTLDMACYSSPCISGCVCPDGLVSDGEGGCVAETECPCVHNEASYTAGQAIHVGCNTCTCKNRMWQCTQEPCLATCAVYGDGHYLTFDGQSFTFDGDCEYTLVQDHCGSNSSAQGSFRVVTENIPCGTTGTTCSKAIKIFLGSYELKLSDGKVEVIEKGAGQAVPYSIRQMGIYLVVDTDVGLILQWDKKTSLFLRLSPEFKGKVCGLCGNFDGNAVNDFTTRSQSVVGDVLEFGNSWKFSPSCPDARAPRNPCTANPYRKSWAQKQCSILHGATFAACHAHVDPTKYYEACVSDACACDSGGDCECFCTAVAAYAQACHDAGVCVSWRSPDVCPLFCDYYNRQGECEWHYQPCGVPCMRTCRNLSGRCLHDVSGLEGCYPRCPPEAPIFDEDKMQCVPQCQTPPPPPPCRVRGKDYRPGASVPSNENCHTCICTENGVVCAYDAKACVCTYNGRHFRPGDVIYNTADGTGSCLSAHCTANGTIERRIGLCNTSTAPTTTFFFSSTPYGTSPVSTVSTVTSNTLSRAPGTSSGSTVSTVMSNIHSTTPGTSSGSTLSTVMSNIRSTAPGTSPVSPVSTVTSNTLSTAPGTFPGSTASTVMSSTLSITPGTSSGSTVSTVTSNTLSTAPGTSPGSPVSTVTSNTLSTAPATSSGSTVSTVTSNTLSTAPATSSGSTVSTVKSNTLSTAPGTSPGSTASTVMSNTLSTAPGTFPGSPVSTVTSNTLSTAPGTSPSPGCGEVCQWTPWLEVSHPGRGVDSGDFDTLQNLRAHGFRVCQAPREVKCRAENTPNVPLEALGQHVECSRTVGLICYNKDQASGLCDNYQIRILCCSPAPCSTTSHRSALTSTSVTSRTTQTTAKPGTKGISLSEGPSTATSGSVHTASTTLSTASTPPAPGTSTSAPGTSTPIKTSLLTPSPTPETTETTSSTEPSTVACLQEMCKWTKWLDGSYPGPGRNGGDFDTFHDLRAKGYNICEHPKEVECRAAWFPDVPLDELGQGVICNTKVGLLCLNKNQLPPICYNYEIRILCCELVDCTWTKWFDVDIPSPGSNGGDVETYDNIIRHGEKVCHRPEEITKLECRAQQHPMVSIEKLGQVVECNSDVGLVCQNRDQTGTLRMCLNYEIRTIPITCRQQCTWTKWFDVDFPSPGPNGGDVETYDNIIRRGEKVCHRPEEITKLECRAEKHPVVSIEKLGQVVECNSDVGLVCRNRDQTGTLKMCLNYEIRTIPNTCQQQCTWTKWFDVDFPSPGPKGGDVETYDNIIRHGEKVCHRPEEITKLECRAEKHPMVSIEKLGQVVECNSDVGLVCRNRDQTGTLKMCLNYEIRVLCCGSTIPTKCTWSKWFDVDFPSPGAHGGDVETYDNIIRHGQKVCHRPEEIMKLECRAENHPVVSIEKLGQVVECNPDVGLVCRNRDQIGTVKMCLNYEIRVLCCQHHHGCPQASVPPNVTSPTAHTVPPVSTSVTSTRTLLSPVTNSTTVCYCVVDKKFYPAGSIIYQKTDLDGHCFYSQCSQDCHVVKNTSSNCPPTTPSPTPATSPSSGCSDLVPPRKKGETWNMPNCTQVTCEGHNVTSTQPVKCPSIREPTCANGYPPLKVADADGCCYHYNCQCICSGWGDPHYITFDGTYYTFLDNCTYVLVQQIVPEYGHFRVLIDNYFCDAEDGLSCPQSIIVEYQQDRVVLTHKPGGVNISANQIIFNNKEVRPGFRSNGIIVSQVGIKMYVSIPAIGLQVMFTGLIFSVEVPFSKFANNTEGQCGICSNDQKDDCRLPGGGVTTSCSKMSNHWKVTNPDQPYCYGLSPTPLPTTSSKLQTSPTPCPPAPICQLILSKVFELCHKVIPPWPYYEGCVFDHCHMRDPKVACSSLEIYASLCASQHVCIDWRGLTNNTCPFTCPVHQVYQPCGPVNLTYCYGNNTAVPLCVPLTPGPLRVLPTPPASCAPFQDPRSFTEGCFCREGLMLFSPSTPVCVPTNCQRTSGTECLGPSGEPVEPGQTVTNNCQECTCDSSTQTLACRAQTCPPAPDCHSPGHVLVHAPLPAIQCCPEYQCVCNTSSCPQLTPCPKGSHFIETHQEGECCLSQKCIYDVCVVNGSLYQPGAVVSSGLCETCRCQGTDDPETDPLAVICEIQICQSNCPVGFQYLVPAGQCCGFCVQVACVMYASNGSAHLFYVSSCRFLGQGGPGGDPVQAPPLIAVPEAGTLPPSAKPFRGRGASLLCLSPRATGSVGAGRQIQRDSSPAWWAGRSSDRASLQPGETWSEPGKPCETHECEKHKDELVVVTTRKACPVLQCPQNQALPDEDGCCLSCPQQPPQNASTCTVYHKQEVVRDGGCSSTQPVRLAYCQGNCGDTASMYSFEANMVEHRCRCCQELRTSLRNVTLSCRDGSTRAFSYHHIEECGCVGPRCDAPGSSSHSESEPEQNTRIRMAMHFLTFSASKTGELVSLSTVTRVRIHHPPRLFLSGWVSTPRDRVGLAQGEGRAGKKPYLEWAGGGTASAGVRCLAAGGRAQNAPVPKQFSPCCLASSAIGSGRLWPCEKADLRHPLAWNQGLGAGSNQIEVGAAAAQASWDFWSLGVGSREGVSEFGDSQLGPQHRSKEWTCYRESKQLPYRTTRVDKEGLALLLWGPGGAGGGQAVTSTERPASPSQLGLSASGPRYRGPAAPLHLILTSPFHSGRESPGRSGPVSQFLSWGLGLSRAAWVEAGRGLQGRVPGAPDYQQATYEGPSSFVALPTTPEGALYHEFPTMAPLGLLHPLPEEPPSSAVHRAGNPVGTPPPPFKPRTHGRFPEPLHHRLAQATSLQPQAIASNRSQQ